jgi:hypothetical protein
VSVVKIGATGVLALAGVGLAGLIVWRVYRTGGQVAEAAAELVTEDLNPASPDNLVNRGLSAIGAAITGEPEWSLGGQVYDWTHTDETDPGRNTLLTAINPADPDNVVNRGLSAIGESISGQPGWSLGGWIYDLTH